MIEVPAGSNGRGLREVGCAHGLGPGLADVEAPAEPADGALLLFEAGLPEPELARAGTVIAFAHYGAEVFEEHADVVFPAPVYAEKEGTVTHPDGRLQRVRQALGHPNEARASWWVLTELCERVGAGLGASSPAVTAALTEAVPFYAGITLDDIGGTGVRWQERNAASALPPTDPSDEALVAPPSEPAGLQLANATDFWAGRDIAESPSLAFLAAGARAELSIEDARAAGVDSGDEIRLTAGGESAVAIAAVRTSVPSGSVFVVGADLPEGAVEIEAAVAVR
jgi:NADH-quinone oxidoreductase subunit G